MFSVNVSEYENLNQSTIEITETGEFVKSLVLRFECDCVGNEFNEKFGSLVSELEDFVNGVNGQIEDLEEEIEDLKEQIEELEEQ